MSKHYAKKPSVDPETRLMSTEMAWWQREIAFMRALDSRMLTGYVRTWNRRVRTFTGGEAPSFGEGTWWTRFHRAQLIARGWIRSTRVGRPV